MVDRSGRRWGLSQVLGGTLLALAALAVVVGGVQVAGDPGPPAGATVDPTASAESVAVDALGAARGADHVADVEPVGGDGGDRRVVWYEPSDREYLLFRPDTGDVAGADLDPSAAEAYVAENGRWRRTDGGWVRGAGSFEPVYRPERLAAAFAAGEASATVEKRDESRVVVRVHFAATAGGRTRDVAGPLTNDTTVALRVVVDRERLRPTLLVATFETAGGRPVQVRARLSGYDTERVERPAGVPERSPATVLYDLSHGPLFGTADSPLGG